MSIIFVNKQFVDASIPSIFANDRGFLLGDGLFETLRSYTGKILFLDQHWERLIQSAHFLNISVPITLNALADNIKELLINNKLEGKNARIRVTLSRGISEPGLSINNSQASLLITASPYSAPTAINNLILSSIHRNELSPLANIKSLNYLDNVLALQEARRNSADEALFLNTKNNLACATAANVFIVIRGKIYTPLLSDGALPGIMRRTIMQLAKMNNLIIEETTIPLSQLQNAEEIFLTNSLVGVREVLHFQNSPTSHTITHILQQALSAHLENSL